MTTTKVSASSRYFARGVFQSSLGFGERSLSRGSSDVESLSYRGFDMGERIEAVREIGPRALGVRDCLSLVAKISGLEQPGNIRGYLLLNIPEYMGSVYIAGSAILVS